MEDGPFKIILWRLLLRNHSSRSRLLPFIPLFFSLCQTLSNAFDTYEGTPQTSNEEFSSNALKILRVIEKSWLTQESFGLKPNWVLLRSLFSIINPELGSKTSFSKNFGIYR